MRVRQYVDIQLHIICLIICSYKMVVYDPVTQYIDKPRYLITRMTKIKIFNQITSSHFQVDYYFFNQKQNNKSYQKSYQDN